MPAGGEPVAYSRDLFAPEGIDVRVMRSLESASPAPVVPRRLAARAPPALAAGREHGQLIVPRDGPAGTARPVGSVDRALALLDALAASESPLGVNELARRIGLNAEHRLAAARDPRAGRAGRARSRAARTGSACTWSRWPTGCWPASTCAHWRARCSPRSSRARARRPRCRCPGDGRGDHRRLRPLRVERRQPGPPRASAASGTPPRRAR